MKWMFAFLLIAPLWSQAPLTPVNRTRLAVPPDILRGDKVQVRVTSGGILLLFEAEAESTAHIGENVIVRNPENGRRFVARVEDKGKVFVKK